MLKSMFGAFALAGMLLTAAAAPAQTPAKTPAQPSAQTMFRPVAVVNDSVITGFDLMQRAQLMVLLGYASANPDALRAAALDRLIDNRLKLQEAKRMGLSLKKADIDKSVAAFAERAGLSVNEFRAALNTHGVTSQALNDKVAADLLWAQVVRSRFARRVEPGEADIDAEIAVMQARAGASYRVLEIGLPGTDAGRTEAQTKALAERLYRSLSQGGDFAAAVKAYSRAPSAAHGGDSGWISTQQMQPDLVNALSTLEPDEVSRPLPVAGGYWIMKLIDKRVEQGGGLDPSNPQLREQVRKELVNRRAARLAEGLLQELRRDAVIEMR
jgi:peptidyl-prolyl cis-trans isomerase SurA